MHQSPTEPQLENLESKHDTLDSHLGETLPSSARSEVEEYATPLRWFAEIHP